MRRAELARAREMEAIQQKNILQAHLANSQFAQKLLGIPMFKAAVDTAGDAYVKVKDSNAFVGKSIELALNISSAVVDKLSPIAEKGINAAAPLTTKVDAIAAASLDGLIARVPVINEQPKEIVQNTRSAIEKQVVVLNGYTEVVLSAWPLQSACDFYEAILKAAYTTLDNVLPPSKDESSEKNGLVSTKEALGEQKKHERAKMLAEMTYKMFSTAFWRVFGKCQTQVENAAHATDIMYKQVRNAVSDTNSTPTTTTDQNNGDANKQSSSKKGKNKKNNQEQ